LAYAGGFYSNLSNYHSFGALKFIPECSAEAYYKILISNPLYNEQSSIYREVIHELWPQVEVEIFNIDKPFTQLNFPFEGGITGYFGRNLTEDDLKAVKEILVHEKLDILNTRAFKRDSDNRLIITVGSIRKQATKKEQKFKEWTYDINYGEFAPYLEECNYYLEHALKYCENELQEQMI
jgi:dipeptidyl-peptidase-3